MGIWVRSQDKKCLINCSDFNVGTFEGSPCIWGGVSDITEDIGPLLGIYSTEAEALMVMDDIYDFLHAADRSVYPMPEAGFSEEHKSELSHEEYLNFVQILNSEGDNDIPTEDEWRAQIKADIAEEESTCINKQR